MCRRRTKRHERLSLNHSECGPNGLTIGRCAAALRDRARDERSCNVAGHAGERLRLVEGCCLDQLCDSLAGGVLDAVVALKRSAATVGTADIRATACGDCNKQEGGRQRKSQGFSQSDWGAISPHPYFIRFLPEQ